MDKIGVIMDERVAALTQACRSRCREAHDRAMKAASKVCSEVLYRCKWSQPPLHPDEQQLINRYCNFLLTNDSRSQFSCIDALRDFIKSNKTGPYSEVTIKVRNRIQAIVDIMLARDAEIKIIENDSALEMKRLKSSRPSPAADPDPSEDKQLPGHAVKGVHDVTFRVDAPNDTHIDAPTDVKSNLRAAKLEIARLLKEKQTSDSLQKTLLTELQELKEQLAKEKESRRETKSLLRDSLTSRTTKTVVTDSVALKLPSFEELTRTSATPAGSTSSSSSKADLNLPPLKRSEEVVVPTSTFKTDGVVEGITRKSIVRSNATSGDEVVFVSNKDLSSVSLSEAHLQKVIRCHTHYQQLRIIDVTT